MRSILSRLKIAIVGIIENNLLSLSSIPSTISNSILIKSSKGNDIKVFRLGQGDHKVLFLSCTHGNEVGTRKLVHELINELDNNKSNYQDFSFYFIPVLNPDGYTLAMRNPDYLNGGRVGRFNYNNVDLNRNFPTSDFKSKGIWSYGPKYSLKKEVFCGDHGGSESETKGLLQLIQQEDIKFIFSYHSSGKDFITSQDEAAKQVGGVYEKYSGFNWQSEKHWQDLKQSGTLKKWCEENKVSLLEIENPTRFGSGWKQQQKAIFESLKILKNHI